MRVFTFFLVMATCSRSVLNGMDVSFKFYEVTRSFNSCSSFNKAHFSLSLIKSSEGWGRAIRFENLFDFPASYLDDPDTRPDNLKKEFEKLISAVKSEKSIPPLSKVDSVEDTAPSSSSSKCSEAEAMTNVVKHLLLATIVQQSRYGI